MLPVCLPHWDASFTLLHRCSARTQFTAIRRFRPNLWTAQIHPSRATFNTVGGGGLLSVLSTAQYLGRVGSANNEPTANQLRQQRLLQKTHHFLRVRNSAAQLCKATAALNHFQRPLPPVTPPREGCEECLQFNSSTEHSHLQLTSYPGLECRCC